MSFFVLTQKTTTGIYTVYWLWLLSTLAIVFWTFVASPSKASVGLCRAAWNEFRAGAPPRTGHGSPALEGPHPRRSPRDTMPDVGCRILSPLGRICSLARTRKYKVYFLGPLLERDQKGKRSKGQKVGFEQLRKGTDKLMGRYYVHPTVGTLQNLGFRVKLGNEGKPDFKMSKRKAKSCERVKWSNPWHLQPLPRKSNGYRIARLGRGNGYTKMGTRVELSLKDARGPFQKWKLNQHVSPCQLISLGWYLSFSFLYCFLLVGAGRGNMHLSKEYSLQRTIPNFTGRPRRLHRPTPGKNGYGREKIAEMAPRKCVQRFSCKLTSSMEAADSIPK